VSPLRTAFRCSETNFQNNFCIPLANIREHETTAPLEQVAQLPSRYFAEIWRLRYLRAKQDPGNAGWQRDLSVSYNKVGDVQRARGDLAGALKSMARHIVAWG
jgi:hypothetical protein